MVKKLRYYARYIVVCLLLNKMDLVKVLVKVWKRSGPFHASIRPERPSSPSSPSSVDDLQELSEEIEDYTQRFNTEDQLEWSLVLQEVAAFVEVRRARERPSRGDASILNALGGCFMAG